MENTYKIYENQTWIDISIHLYGNVGYSFELAVLNNASPSEILIAGREIVYNTENKRDELVLKSLNANNSIPAGGIIDNLIEVKPLSGINYWEIGETFEVQ